MSEGPARRKPHRAAPEGRSSDRSASFATDGALALRLTEWAREAGSGGLIHVARSEGRAERLARAAAGLDPALEVVVFPPWDCLPYDRVSPSRAAMGKRLDALRRLADRAGSRSSARACLVATTIEGVTQRLPPRPVVESEAAFLVLATGEMLARDTLEEFLRRTGYSLDERVDEPGEVAIRGEVIDVFPAGDELPCRIDLEGDRIRGMRRYDPASQRTLAEVDRLVMGPASEVLLPPEDAAALHYPGIEHELPRFYHPLELLFDYLPGAAIVLDPEVEDRRAARFEQIADAYEGRRSLPQAGRAGVHVVPPDHLYVDEAEWRRHVENGRRPLRRLADAGEGGGDTVRDAVPRFAIRSDPAGAFARFAEARLAQGGRVAVGAADERTLSRLVGIVRRRLRREARRVAGWSELEKLPRGSLAALIVDLDAGFAQDDAVLVAAPDVLGSDTGGSGGDPAGLPLAADAAGTLRPGDVVIHIDRGVGVLKGLETIASADADDATGAGDCLRVEYAGGETLLVPVEEIDKVWRYGADAGAVSLDRLDNDRWAARRRQVEADIAATARALVQAAREHEAATAPSFVPPRRAYERFVTRFPYGETADQARAIADTLRDLGSGRPMDRLLCGDVGFGKTEVALRAAAAVALAGAQVALAAPTTVLVRQHLDTFRRRFAGVDGVAIEQLSRRATPAEARRVRQGLAQGTVRIVIGTQALAGKAVAFDNLGLLIIDEEQRFGTKQKQILRALAGKAAHVLTLTATPIPRTLHSALVGLQSLSVIAAAPVRRQPVRTFVVPFDLAVVRAALRREHARGGQSFVVCPRIEDIAPMAERLAALVPDLDIVCAHGRMSADRLDDVMIDFAEGRADVLLTTNIIETGLDVPAANTIIVWRADRFGLAQLHQLRGRVGRGRVRAAAYLLTDPQSPPPRATEERLRTLAAHDRLGAGFAISARDLDLRGAGDLLGSAQTGHMRLIGIDLYRHLLAGALAAARGEPQAEEWFPELRLGVPLTIPADYIPAEEVRIELWRRIGALRDADAVDDLEAEIEDRFGPPPGAMRDVLGAARLRVACRELGILRLEAGPQAIALTARGGRGRNEALAGAVAASGKLQWRGERLIAAMPTAESNERIAAAAELLSSLA